MSLSIGDLYGLGFTLVPNVYSTGNVKRDGVPLMPWKVLLGEPLSQSRVENEVRSITARHGKAGLSAVLSPGRIMVDFDDEGSFEEYCSLFGEPQTLGSDARRGPHFFYQWPEGVEPPSGGENQQGIHVPLPSGKRFEVKWRCVTMLPDQPHRKDLQCMLAWRNCVRTVATAPEALVEAVTERLAAFNEAKPARTGSDLGGSFWADLLRRLVADGRFDELLKYKDADWGANGVWGVYCPFEHEETEHNAFLYANEHGAGFGCHGSHAPEHARSVLGLLIDAEYADDNAGAMAWLEANDYGSISEVDIVDALDAENSSLDGMTIEELTAYLADGSVEPAPDTTAAPSADEEPAVSKKATTSKKATQSRYLDIVNMEDVEPEEMTYLYDKRIPYNFVTLLGGDGDSCKTYTTVFLTAAVTNGGQLPVDNGMQRIDKGRVLMLNYEDGTSAGIAKILAQRGRKCGVNAKLWRVVRGTVVGKNKDGTDKLKPFSNRLRKKSAPRR